jgi:hypothetical protein
MSKRKKPPTQPPTQPQVEASKVDKPHQVETKPQSQSTLPFEIKKISNEEYLAYNSVKKESEYAKIAHMIIEKALESDTPLLIKLPPNIPARRIVPILAKITSDLWKNGTKIEFKASYKNNEIAIRHIKGRL